MRYEACPLLKPLHLSPFTAFEIQIMMFLFQHSSWISCLTPYGQRFVSYLFCWMVSTYLLPTKCCSVRCELNSIPSNRCSTDLWCIVLFTLALVGAERTLCVKSNDHNLAPFCISFVCCSFVFGWVRVFSLYLALIIRYCRFSVFMHLWFHATAAARSMLLDVNRQDLCSRFCISCVLERSAWACLPVRWRDWICRWDAELSENDRNMLREHLPNDIGMDERDNLKVRLPPFSNPRECNSLS